MNEECPQKRVCLVEDGLQITTLVAINSVRYGST